MLTLANRADYRTILDAAALKPDQPDATAIIYIEADGSATTISRAEFLRQAQRAAAALTAQGVRARDLIVIAHTQNLECIYAFWGALLIDAIPSMFPTLTEKLDPAIYMRGITALAEREGVRAVFTTDAFAETLRPLVACAVYGTSDVPNAAPLALAGAAPAPDAIAFLQHSSGTTGLQKGVALSHQAVLNHLASYGEAIALNATDVIVSWLPLYHDMGLIAGFLMPLIQGIPLVLMSPFDWVRAPVMLFRAISAHGGTLCWLPNFAYNHCARRIRDRDLEGLSIASMRLFINTSENVSDSSHRQFLERFAAIGCAPHMISTSYGMAENVFAVSQTQAGQQPLVETIDRVALETQRLAVPVPPEHPNAISKVSCGTAIPGTQIRVIDLETGAVLGERHVGEYAITSNCLLSEYYRRPDLNPIEADGWYRTGDIGYLADGHVYVSGRSKDLIINGGKNIFPADIETIVNEIEGVYPGRVVAFGVPDEREGTELIAIVAELRGEHDDATRQRIQVDIRRTVANRAGVTASFVKLVDDRWLIKTSSGKIARSTNRDKWLREQAQEAE